MKKAARITGIAGPRITSQELVAEMACKDPKSAEHDNPIKKRGYKVIDRHD